jgi:hypothetical protein
MEMEAKVRACAEAAAAASEEEEEEEDGIEDVEMASEAGESEEA